MPCFLQYGCKWCLNHWTEKYWTLSSITLIVGEGQSWSADSILRITFKKIQWDSTMVRINIKLLVATPRINEICTLTILQSQAIKHRSLKKQLRIQCPSMSPLAIPDSSMFKIIGEWNAARINLMKSQYEHENSGCAYSLICCSWILALARNLESKKIELWLKKYWHNSEFNTLHWYVLGVVSINQEANTICWLEYTQFVSAIIFK
jgi:hypothetical protein